MNTKAVFAVLVFAASLGTVTIASATPFDAKAFTANHPDSVQGFAACEIDSHGRPTMLGVSFSPVKNPVGDYGATKPDALGNVYGFTTPLLMVFVSDHAGAQKCLLPDGFEATPTTSGSYLRP
jgi:hypothetical protein